MLQGVCKGSTPVALILDGGLNTNSKNRFFIQVCCRTGEDLDLSALAVAPALPPAPTAALAHAPAPALAPEIPVRLYYTVPPVLPKPNIANEH